MNHGAVLSVPGKIWSFTSFRTVFVTDDPITEAPDPNSTPVGRGQGMYITSKLDGSTTHVLISIVFTNGQFSGSTLEIQGSSPHFQKYREVFVVSETGGFVLQGAMLYLRLFLLTHELVTQ
ncbi:Dirigent protein 1 [Vitis vinifera]|uniref:Dirigent protein n=1 Tax=Vitis vinifera TaxID=29760 RepID=A0A438DTY9_VITVI|nr:Dirigent protein 1 [Vitis vinifera]